MAGGYMGKLLRVNLTQGTISEEMLPAEDVLRKYIGGAGLGVKILSDELPPAIAPLDPENRLIFMTGPLTGTLVPCANNTSIVFLNYETGYTVGTAHAHGYFGPYLKFAGYDGIIVQGEAKSPVYLWIHDGKAEIRDASKLWGKDTHETEDLVKEEIGPVEDASVAAIGPAGENLIHGAGIQNDKHHLFAKGGVGAVMGSKKLKAIAVGGKLTRGVPLADVQGLLAANEAWRNSLYHSGGAGLWGVFGNIDTGKKRYSGVGATSELMLKFATTLQAVTNLSDPSFGVQWVLPLYTEALKFKVKSVGCFSCNQECNYAAEITTGPYKGFVATLAGGGENMEGAAGMIGVMDAGTCFWLTDYYDRLGLDSSTPGCAISLAFECYERGIITKEDTDGLELKWGNAEAAIKLLDKLVRREGFGAVLADGPKKAAERIGGDAPKLAVHVKGGGMNLHDWRSAWSVLLGQAVAGAGPCWQAPGVDAFCSEPDLGYPKLSDDPVSAEGKPEAVAKTQRKKLWEDSIGICWFGTWGVPGSLSFVPQAVAATTGWADFTPEEALTVGERVITLERIFNLKRGLTVESDLDVPPRLLDAPTSGIAEGKAFGDFFPGMLKEYYQIMGWDPETGRPLPETVKRLDLEEAAQGI